jgi:hypothetical protein
MHVPLVCGLIEQREIREQHTTSPSSPDFSAAQFSKRSPDERSDIRVDGCRKTIPAYRYTHAGYLLRPAHSTFASKRLRQPSLAQDRVGGVATGNADRYGKISLGDRAMPDFVAALALPDERATGGT